MSASMKQLVHTPETPKWPELEMPLVGENADGLVLVGRFHRVLTGGVKAGVLTAEERDAAVLRAMDGGYDHMLWVVSCYVSTS